MDLYDRTAYKFEGGLGALYELSEIARVAAHICILHTLKSIIQTEKYVLIKFCVSNV